MSKADELKYGKAANRRTIGDWVDEHRLESWILPLRTRKVNPLEIIEQVKTRLGEMPKTQSTLTFQNLGYDQLAEEYKRGIMQLFLLRQCEHISKPRFLNPNYMHYGHTLDPVTDADERMRLFQQFKQSPYLSLEWLSTHFGISNPGVSNFLRRRGYKVREIRRENRARFGRTLATLQKWGYIIMDLARLLPGNPHMVREWKQHFALDEGYEPPSRPTEEPWYGRHARQGDR